MPCFEVWDGDRHAGHRADAAVQHGRGVHKAAETRFAARRRTGWISWCLTENVVPNIRPLPHRKCSPSFSPPNSLRERQSLASPAMKTR
jgi:hypothetical protein